MWVLDEPQTSPALDRLRDQLQGIFTGKFVSSILHALRPEILQPRKLGSPRSLSRTAWLDGLRGWAALIVCWVHLSVTSHHDLEYCNGYEVAPGVFRHSPAMWPYVRILFSGGQFAVAIFFTISGYVLTRKLTSLLHEGRRDDFLDAIQSAIFRRPIRLMLPVMWSILAWCILWHVFDFAVPGHEKQANLVSEFFEYLVDMASFAYFYSREMNFSKYNLHTWTIPVELRGSMLVFVWLFGTYTLHNRVRIYGSIIMTMYLGFLTNGAWYACFFSGMLISEMSLLYAETCPVRFNFIWDSPLHFFKRWPVLKTATLHFFLLVGLWFGSAPADQSLSPGLKFDHCPIWNPLIQFLPPAYGFFSYRWFWFLWGAMMVITAAQGLAWLRQIFEWRFSQYLGRISFTLYLIHGYLIALLSERLFWLAGVYNGRDPATVESFSKFGHLNNRWFELFWWPFPASGPYGLEPNYLFSAGLSLIVFLYLAEIGTRVFDTPSVQFANWVYTKFKIN